MNNQRFTHFLGDASLLYKHTFLLLQGSSALRIEPGLTYCHHPGVGSKCTQTSKNLRVNTLAIPRMYTHAIPGLAGRGIDSVVGTDICYHRRPPAAMSVYIIEIFELHRVREQGRSRSLPTDDIAISA